MAKQKAGGEHKDRDNSHIVPESSLEDLLLKLVAIASLVVLFLIFVYWQGRSAEERQLRERCRAASSLRLFSVPKRVLTGARALHKLCYLTDGDRSANGSPSPGWS